MRHLFIKQMPKQETKAEKKVRIKDLLNDLDFPSKAGLWTHLSFVSPLSTPALTRIQLKGQNPIISLP